MSKPLVAIVGRPNVGKSMLFNKLCGKRLSIVEDTPGVTRDRLYAECEWCGRKFDIVDTGGIEPTTDNEILSFMREQANIAINAADVIILVTDVRTGFHGISPGGDAAAHGTHPSVLFRCRRAGAILRFHGRPGHSGAAGPASAMEPPGGGAHGADHPYPHHWRIQERLMLCRISWPASISG